MKKYLIFRILGNDLSGLHGNNQTLENLEFTLKNEKQFLDTEKIYLLNKIYNINKKAEIERLLIQYKCKYIDLPFSFDKFKKIKYDKKLNDLNYENVNYKARKFLIQRFLDFKKRQNVIKKLHNHNLYAINNNGSRNFCIEYGKQNNYDWTFVLDSNSFFTEKLFEDIINNIQDDTEYIILPQIRLSDNDIENEQLLKDNFDYNSFEIREPQIAFKVTSKIKFNKKIPYGLSPKAELLRVLQIAGPWSQWKDNERYLKIKDRKIENVKYQILSKIIRLNSYNSSNNFNNNFINRIIGVNNLIKHIRTDNK